MNKAGTKQNLLDLDREGLERFFADVLGEQRYRAHQVMKWIHHRHVTDFDDMTDLGKPLRAKLQTHAEVIVPNILLDKPSEDGTHKWLLGMDGGNAIEAVFIPDKGRGTLCVSSQVGCGLACTFCSTGTQGFNRNLSTAEIVGQVWVAARHLGNVPHRQRKLTNVVMMGMGEPLLNFDNVVRAMSVMRDDLGFGLANKRVTLSTAGMVPMIDRLAVESDVSLAVSLHAPNDELRSELVPLNKKYPITELMAACQRYVQRKPRASITFEPDDNNTLYASYSRGFKGGGFDPRGLSPTAPDLNGNGVREESEIFDYFLFEPEKVTSYEVGYKASLFDRRLRFAVAGFYADYKDVQVPGSAGAVINGVPTFVGVTTNAGKATFKGIEVETTATLARDFGAAGSRLNLAGTLGYIDAQFDEYITNIAGTGPVDVADFREIQNTPKWTASGTLDYSVPVGGGEVAASTTVSYRSKTFQFELPSPYLDQPGYALWDANLVWTSPGDRYTIGLHAKNITDKQYITSGYQFLVVNPTTGVPTLTAGGAPTPSLGREGVATAFYGNPRQVFASFGVKF